MTFTFDTYEEYLAMQQCAHDAVVFWKKQKQCVEGKINMNVDGSPTHYDMDYVMEKLRDNALILKAIEDSIHPDYTYDYDEDSNISTTTHVIVDGTDSYSCILYKILGKDFTPKGGKIIETKSIEVETLNIDYV